MQQRLGSITIVLALCSLAACRSDGRTLDPPTAPLPTPTTVAPSTVPGPPTFVTEAPPQPMSVIASWPDGAAIPDRYTCEGAGLSPPLTWTGVPAGTLELALTVSDLDNGQYVHWLVDAMNGGRTGITEDQPPEEAIIRLNGAGQRAWEAPCPPPGETHRYQFTVHALNQQLEVADDLPAAEVVALLNVIATDQGSVTGVVARDG